MANAVGMNNRLGCSVGYRKVIRIGRINTKVHIRIQRYSLILVRPDIRSIGILKTIIKEKNQNNLFSNTNSLFYFQFSIINIFFKF